jgi:hypothetical protein
MNHLKYALCIVFSAFAFSAAAQQFPEKHFSHPDRIRYDGSCLTIDGKDTFILSAAFHYFRCPQALWRQRFRKIKEAGFNTVETYVPWNWHERNMPSGLNDYSQCNFDELKAWLKMAHEEFHLYTIVRPGPYICAEWAGGGHPRWLARFRPKKITTSFWIRSNNPDYLKWSEHWYNAVCPVLRNELITHKKPGEAGTILVQMENEFVYFNMSSAGKEDVLRHLVNTCVRNGIDVPLFTCVTPEARGSKDKVVGQLFDMDNQYLWWNVQESTSMIERLKRQQPNAPAFVCELQGGWFSSVGGNLSEDFHLDGRHARDMALMAMAGGATGLNYYMFFGGTNLTGWGTRQMTTSYDYGAPIKEDGGVGEKYAAVKGIAEIVQKFGKQLVRTVPVPVRLTTDSTRLTVSARKSADGTLFVFFLNRDAKQTFQQMAHLVIDGTPLNVDCTLNSQDSKLLVLHPDGTTLEWFPRTQSLPRRPDVLPAPVTISKALCRTENFKGQWMPLRNNLSLPEMGVNDSRYVMYRSHVSLSVNEVSRFGSLVFNMFTGDPVYVQINGKCVPRASENDLDNTFVVNNALHEGDNLIEVIYENRGHAHGYQPMEELSGMKQAGLGGQYADVLPVEEWYVKPLNGTVNPLLSENCSAENGWQKMMLNPKTIAELATLQIAGLQKPEWPAAWILKQKTGSALFRTQIDWTPDMIRKGQTQLEFGCIDDKGTLWVNGVNVASHDDWDKPFVVDVARYIKPGRNDIAVEVSNQSGDGGILKAVRLRQNLSILKNLKWEVSTDLGGVQQGWTQQQCAADGWTELTLSPSYPLVRKNSLVASAAPASSRDGLFTWYRMTFNLPAADSSVWIPWQFIVNAVGTGYIWLNGHNIGRYWNEGPQRSFFLPDCWLHFGGANTLVLGLRQTEKAGAQLLGAEISPYAEDAECVEK